MPALDSAACFALRPRFLLATPLPTPLAVEQGLLRQDLDVEQRPGHWWGGHIPGRRPYRGYWLYVGGPAGPALKRSMMPALDSAAC